MYFSYQFLHLGFWFIFPCFSNDLSTHADVYTHTYRWLHWLHANIHAQSYIFEFTLFKKNRLLKRSSIIYLCMCLSLFVVFLSTVSKEFYSICTIYSIYPSVYLSIHPSIYLSISESMSYIHINVDMQTCRYKHLDRKLIVGHITSVLAAIIVDNQWEAVEV